MEARSETWSRQAREALRSVSTFCKTKFPWSDFLSRKYFPMLAVYDSTMLQIPPSQFIDSETISWNLPYPGVKYNVVCKQYMLSVQNIDIPSEIVWIMCSVRRTVLRPSPMFCVHCMHTFHDFAYCLIFMCDTCICRPYYCVNPFTPESDQSQISPPAPPEILHHTVRRTWLFIAYSDERWL